MVLTLIQWIANICNQITAGA